MSPELRTIFEGMRQQAYEAATGHGETLDEATKALVLKVINHLGVILDS